MNVIPDTINWADYERETEDASKIRPAGVFLDDMIENIGNPEAKEHQSYLPWEKSHKNFAFRRGEVTLWAGVNGHGKSEVTGMVSSSLVTQNERVCIASFEMKPRRTLSRMVRQFIGLDDTEVSREEIELLKAAYGDFQAMCDQKLWFYDQQGTVSPERVLSVARYCFKELKINHVFIDSLMKCVKGEDDYNGQKALVDELTSIARDYMGHVHLIHHLRKSGKETDQPDKSDVKGSGSIVDQVDNLILVWRNKQKELDKMAGKNRIMANGDPEHDTILFVRKQRNGTGWEGGVGLYYDPASKQYTSSQNCFIDMAPWPHIERMK